MLCIDVACRSSFQQIESVLSVTNDPFGLGNLEVVFELRCREEWVGPSCDSTGADDTKPYWGV